MHDNADGCQAKFGEGAPVLGDEHLWDKNQSPFLQKQIRASLVLQHSESNTTELARKYDDIKLAY